MNGKTRTTLAVIGACATFGSMVVVGLASNPGRAMAGSGNGIDSTYAPPTVTSMTLGATATAGPAATTVSMSLASPTHKAVPLAAECNTTGQCP